MASTIAREAFLVGGQRTTPLPALGHFGVFLGIYGSMVMIFEVVHLANKYTLFYTKNMVMV